MKRAHLVISLFILSMTLLYACDTDNDEGGGNDNTDNDDETTDEVTYKTTFSEDSPEYQSLIEGYITADMNFQLLSDNGINVYAKENRDSDEDTIEYQQYSSEELKELYEELTDVMNMPLEELRDVMMSMFDPVEDKTDYHLPDITKKDGNVLGVKTEANEDEFMLSDMLDSYNVKAEDDLIFNLVAVDESGMQIDIENKSSDDFSGRDVSIFMSQDLETVLVTQTFTENFAESIAAGDLDEFEGLLEYADDKRIVRAANSNAIVDTNTDEVIDVNEPDVISDDFKYVYLDGDEDPLPEGTQCIQTLDGYVDGNDENDSTYDLDYKEISDELDLESEGEIRTGEIQYFDKDYIILFIDFSTTLSEGFGSTNVVVDLEDNEKPEIYLLNLVPY